MWKIIVIFSFLYAEAYTQTDSFVDSLLKKVYYAANNMEGIQVDLDISLKYFADNEPIIKQLHYEIIRDTMSILGYWFSANDESTGSAQWLCNDTMCIVNAPDTTVKYVEFEKYGLSDFQNNIWNIFILKWFADFNEDYLFKKERIESITWVKIDTLNEYVINIHYLRDAPSDFYTEKYTIDSRYLYLKKIEIRASWNNMIQIFEFKVKNISRIDKRTFCDQINEYLEYKKTIYTPVLMDIKKDSVPSFIPSFLLPSTEDSSIHLYKFSDITIMYFWYTGCAACIQTTPVIDSLYNYFRYDCVHVIGINPYDDKTKMKNYLDDRKIEYINYYNAENYSKSLNIESFPRIYLVNENGHVINYFDGYRRDMLAQIRKTIELYLHEQKEAN